MRSAWRLPLSSVGRATYLGLGLVLSQLLNVVAYRQQGGSSVLTLIGLVQGWLGMPQSGLATYPMSTALLASAGVDLTVFLLSWLSFRRMARAAGALALDAAIALAVVGAGVSQLAFTSVFRLLYEFSFGAVAGLSVVVVGRLWRQDVSRSGTADLLRSAATICLSFPVVVSTGGLLSSFYKDQPILGAQLYRHALLAVYFEFGAYVFLLRPLARRLLAWSSPTRRWRSAKPRRSWRRTPRPRRRSHRRQRAASEAVPRVKD